MSSPQLPGREALSSFMDGEIENGRIDELVKACRHGETLRADWALYHCIGDVLRSEETAMHSSALARAVSERLAAEPALVAAPRRPAAPRSARLAASLAAAVAAVAAVAYVALPGGSGSAADPGRMAAAPGATAAKPAAGAAAAVAAAPAGPAAPMPPVSHEFLAAHRQFSGGIAMQAMLGQVRSVALETER